MITRVNNLEFPSNHLKYQTKENEFLFRCASYSSSWKGEGSDFSDDTARTTNKMHSIIFFHFEYTSGKFTCNYQGWKLLLSWDRTDTI